MQQQQASNKQGGCFKLPVETQHMLRQECKRRKLMPADVVTILDSALIAGAIIKDAAADRRLKALAIARRLQYCIDPSSD